MTLEQLIGRTLVIGVPGTKITPQIVAHFKALNAGGLILYRINFESPRQLKKMISDLENALERRLLIMADHEGGRVIMFRDGITVFPDNLALGSTKNVEYARKQGAIDAKELRRLGMDVNLGPVMDVLTDAYSPNIGIRSYGQDWKLVSEMGAARIVASQKGGLSTCAKHFPGKGHAPVDAHLGLPVIRSTWAEMEATHLKPFERAIAAGVDCVMSSHPHYPNLDPEPNRIATFSKIIVGDLLRGRMGFEGVIVSDDLEMGAIRAICPIDVAAVRAVQAGHDLLLICHDMEAQKKVYAKLVEAYKDGTLPKPELEKSAERIDALQQKRAKRFAGGEPKPEAAGKRLAERIANESAAALKNPGFLPLKKSGLKGRKLAAIFPRFSFFDSKIMIERDVLKEARFVAAEFSKYGVKPKAQIVSIEPDDREIAQAQALARASDLTVLFCFDAHLYPSNKKLLDAVQGAGETAVVLLRDPYDAAFVRDGAACVTDFGWRACQVRASIRKLFRP